MYSNETKEYRYLYSKTKLYILIYNIKTNNIFCCQTKLFKNVFIKYCFREISAQKIYLGTYIVFKCCIKTNLIVYFYDIKTKMILCILSILYFKFYLNDVKILFYIIHNIFLYLFLSFHHTRYTAIKTYFIANHYFDIDLVMQ